MKKLIIITLAFCLLFALSATALAATDTAGHWAEGELNEWESESLITGDGAGELRPNDAITRAEFMAIVNRWRGYQGTSDKISQFTDVAQGAWYYNEISAALAAGYITGNPDMTMNPNAPITREEAMAIVARINAMTDAEDKTVLSKASDGSDIAAWAQGLVAAVVNEGLIGGSEGKLTPKANITRAEAVTLFDRVRDNVRIYTFEGTYGPATGKQAVSKVIVAGSGVVLRNLNVSGELTVNVPNAVVTVTDSTVATVTIPNPNTTLNTTGATTLNAVNANAAGAKIATSAGTSIGTLTMNAATTVSGTGNVSVANVKSEGVVMEKAPGISNIDSGLTADIGTGGSTGGTTGGDPSAPGTGGSVTDPTPPPTPSIGIASVTLTGANTIEIKLNSNIDIDTTETENDTDYIRVVKNGTSTVLAESHSYNANTFTYTVTFTAALVNKDVLNIAMAKKGYSTVNRTLTVDFTPFVLGEISAAMDSDNDNNPYFDDLYANYDRKVAITSGTFTVKKGAETIWFEDVAAMGVNPAAWFSYGLRNLGATTGAGAAKIATGAGAGKPLFPSLKDADIGTVEEPARGEIERTNTYLLDAGTTINIAIEVVVEGDMAGTYTVSKDYTVTASDKARATFKDAATITAQAEAFLTGTHKAIIDKAAVTNDIVIGDKAAVNAAIAAADLLGAAVKNANTAIITAIANLDAAKAKIDDIQAGLDADAFENAHSAALALTTTNVAVANKAAVTAAKNAYAALSDAAKAKVTGGDPTTKLDTLLARIAVLEAAEKFKADHATALAIVLDQDSTKWSFTNAQISAINAASAAYNALPSNDVKTLLINDGTADKISNLVAALKVFQDKNAAAAFKLLYKDALALTVKASYTEAEIKLVTDARKAYNALNSEAQGLLTTENTTLTNLEAAIKPSQDANAFKEAHKDALALAVKETYTADEIGLINAAVAAYTAITDTKVTALLTTEKTKLDSLVEAITSSDAGDAAEAFKTTHATALALTVANVATTNETIVNTAVTAYNALTAEAKALLTTEKTLLDNLVARITVLKAAETAAETFKTTHATALALTGQENAYTAEQIDSVTAAIEAFKSITNNDIKALLTAGNNKLVNTVTPNIGTVINADITVLKNDAMANDTELQFPLGIAAADFNARVEAALAVETLQTAAGKENLISAENRDIRAKAKTAADRAMALDAVKADLFWTTAEDVIFSTNTSGGYVDADGTALTDLALPVTVAVAFNENKEFYTFIQLGTATETVRSLDLETVDYYTGENVTAGSGTLIADEVIMVVSRIPLAADRTPSMKRDDTGQGGVNGMTAMEKPEAGEGGLLENFPTSGAGNADNLMQDFLRITNTDGSTGAMRFGFNYGPSVANGPDLIEYFWLFIHVGAND